MDGSGYDLIIPAQATSGFIANLATSLYSPVLARKKMEIQDRIVEKSMENRNESLHDIMRTMRDLSKDGNLTQDRFNSLLMVYTQIATMGP